MPAKKNTCGVSAKLFGMKFMETNSSYPMLQSCKWFHNHRFRFWFHPVGIPTPIRGFTKYYDSDSSGPWFRFRLRFQGFPRILILIPIPELQDSDSDSNSRVSQIVWFRFQFWFQWYMIPIPILIPGIPTSFDSNFMCLILFPILIPILIPQLP